MVLYINTLTESLSSNDFLNKPKNLKAKEPKYMNSSFYTEVLVKSKLNVYVLKRVLTAGKTRISFIKNNTQMSLVVGSINKKEQTRKILFYADL